MQPALKPTNFTVQRMTNDLRRAFHSDLTFRSCQLDTRRLAASGEELAAQLHDSLYSATDLARFAETGMFVMREFIDVKLINSKSPRALNGNRFDRLVFKGMRPFALGFDMLTLDAGTELGGFVDDRLSQIGMVAISPSAASELQAVLKMDLTDCTTPLEVLYQLATAGSLANQLAFDMVTTGGAFMEEKEES